MSRFVTHFGDSRIAGLAKPVKADLMGFAAS
jgi:hypothetical protein